MKSPLAEYRKAHRKTLEEIGAALGVNKSTILRWEDNQVPVERLADVEKVTGISRQELRPDIFGTVA